MIGRTLAYAVLMVGVAGWAAKIAPTYLAARDYAAEVTGESASRSDASQPNAGRGRVTLAAGRGGHFHV